MKGFEKLAESIAKMPPNSALLICVEKCRNPSFFVCAAGCSFNKDTMVCDYCKADQPIDVYETDLESLALGNGYVKACDLDAIKAHVDDQVLDCIRDAHLRVEQLRDEDFGAVAALKGYVKLKPGQVVVDAKPIIEHCEACNEEGLKVVCDGCVLRPIRDRIKEARDE